MDVSPARCRSGSREGRSGSRSGSREGERRHRTRHRDSSGHSRSKSDTSVLFRDFPSNSVSSNQLYSDRFIPSRLGSNLDTALTDIKSPPSTTTTTNTNTTNPASQYEEGKDNTVSSSYSILLRDQILGIRGASTDLEGGSRSVPTSPHKGTPGKSSRTFRFKSPRKLAAADSPYALSPVSHDSQRFLSSSRKTTRKISGTPFKVLDAPSLKDDFYLNLVSWSSQNVLAVGLASCVYLWSACTSKVTMLCDLGENDSVTGVCWAVRGSQLAVGTRSGQVQLWDPVKCKKLKTMKGHVARVGALAWGSQLLASGSRDRTIYLRDHRSPEHYIMQLTGHKQEVCGLKWSPNDAQLASGGNDNKLLIWNAQSNSPVIKFSDHTAAVKAIAWSPHQHGLLASGGGTADRCIRFWNTLNNTPLQSVDTGSQVCNLMWSKNVNEIVSTHGYSLNQIIVWKYPTMQSIATLTGHSFRVLYLANSPDGQTIVTGAGDETLRFWNVFPSSKAKAGNQLGSKLFFPGSSNIR